MSVRSKDVPAFTTRSVHSGYPAPSAIPPRHSNINGFIIFVKLPPVAIANSVPKVVPEIREGHIHKLMENGRMF